MTCCLSGSAQKQGPPTRHVLRHVTGPIRSSESASQTTDLQKRGSSTQTTFERLPRIPRGKQPTPPQTTQLRSVPNELRATISTTKPSANPCCIVEEGIKERTTRQPTNPKKWPSFASPSRRCGRFDACASPFRPGASLLLLDDTAAAMAMSRSLTLLAAGSGESSPARSPSLRVGSGLCGCLAVV